MTSVGIFGLGQVGSAVARRCATVGLDVQCVDIDPTVVKAVTDGTYFEQEFAGTVSATTDGESVAADSDVLIVAVPTPLSSSYSVDLDPLRAVSKTIAGGTAQSDQSPLLIVESTVPPGTGSTVVTPILEDAGLVVDKDVFLASAPERIDPGNEEWPLERIPRVIGTNSERARERAVQFYESILKADITPVETIEIAETSKIIENAFRDVNIAFVNELAVSLDELGIDATAALDAAATKPFGFMRFSPGAGVGGDCIPVDPYLLIERAQESGFDHQFLKLARDINDEMPDYVVEKTIKALNHAYVLPREATVVLLGRAFKPGIADDRNSPYHEIRRKFHEYGVTVETYDPQFPTNSTVDSPYAGGDALVLVTVHDQFRDLDWERVADSGVEVVVDGRNVYSPATVESYSLDYVGIGR